MTKLHYPVSRYWQFICYFFFIRFQTKVERSSQDESSDNSMQVLDEFQAEKSDDERNLTQTSVMQSMYVLL